MAISRMQQPRQQYGLGSIVKSVKKAVKGVTRGVKDFAKSDLGKAAGLAALAFGIPGAPGALGGGLFGRASLGGAATGLFGQQGIAATLGNLSMPAFLSKSTGEGAALKNFGKVFAGGTALTALLGAAEEGDEEALAATQDVGALRKYLSSYYSNLGYTADQIAENVARDTSEYTSGAGGYADGGRIGFNSGTPKGSIMTLIDGTKVQIPAGAYKDGKFKDIIYSSNKGDLLREEIVRKLEFNEGGRVNYAMGTGDKVEMAAGIEGLDINVNPKGVKELDLRETGGFIAPVGVKEKADDIPAMLSNNEFVFTADAVRAAGGGSVDKGAQIMYDTMKKLESKVV